MQSHHPPLRIQVVMCRYKSLHCKLRRCAANNTATRACMHLKQHSGSAFLTTYDLANVMLCMYREARQCLAVSRGMYDVLVSPVTETSVTPPRSPLPPPAHCGPLCRHRHSYCTRIRSGSINTTGWFCTFSEWS